LPALELVIDYTGALAYVAFGALPAPTLVPHDSSFGIKANITTGLKTTLPRACGALTYLATDQAGVRKS
jgi:hypothetical protein